MKCPVCRATYRSSGRSETAPRLCRRCGADLTALVRLHDTALWHHRQAIAAFQAGDPATAQSHNDRALALHNGEATFHALAGQLWALQGEFAAASTAWKRAQECDPKLAQVGNCLEILEALRAGTS